jgi:phage terminase large subunit
VLRRTEFEVLYGGARGGGKSEAMKIWLLELMNEPRARALVLRRNADDLRDFIDRAGQLYIPMGATLKGGDEFHWPSGYIIRTGHLKDDTAYTKYQGHEYQKLAIEELTQIPEERRYLALLASCRSSIPGVVPQIFLTTNPGGIGHSWVKRRFVDAGPPGQRFKDPKTGLTRVFIPSTVDDNPQLRENDPQYLAVLDSMRDADPETYKAWRFGDWSVFVGQFFPEWKKERHQVPFHDVAFQARWFGYDYGYANPMACLWVGQDFDGRMWVYRELYGTGKTENQQVSEIAQLNQGDAPFGIVDPAIFAQTRQGYSLQTRSIADEFMAQQVAVQPGNNNRRAGWARLRSLLAKEMPACPYHREQGMAACPSLHVMDSCPNLIRTLPELVYDERDKEDCDTEGEDHAPDALRYALMAMPQEEASQTHWETHIMDANPYTGWGGTPVTRPR